MAREGLYFFLLPGTITNINTNTHDNIDDAVLMTVIVRVHRVRLMNVEQCHTAVDPQTKSTDLGWAVSCYHLHPPSPFSIIQTNVTNESPK